MNMMSKCANYHADILSGYRLKFIPVSVIELSETANFVYNFEHKTHASAQLWWHI